MNNKNLQVANFFWGGKLSSYEIANILSFKKNNFKVNVWSYQDLDLPDGMYIPGGNVLETLNKVNRQH